MNTPLRHSLLLTALLLLTSLTGCASTPRQFADPIAMMLLKSESDSVRMDAAKQAEKSMAEDPSRIALPSSSLQHAIVEARLRGAQCDER